MGSGVPSQARGGCSPSNPPHLWFPGHPWKPNGLPRNAQRGLTHSGFPGSPGSPTTPSSGAWGRGALLALPRPRGSGGPGIAEVQAQVDMRGPEGSRAGPQGAAGVNVSLKASQKAEPPGKHRPPRPCAISLGRGPQCHVAATATVRAEIR